MYICKNFLQKLYAYDYATNLNSQVKKNPSCYVAAT